MKSDTVRHLASIWLWQQDLSKKSPEDTLDMYIKAKQEIRQAYNEKYVSKEKSQSGRHTISPGIKPGDL